jgi:predicted RND superfamily exporter protein
LDARIIGGSEFSVIVDSKDGRDLKDLSLMKAIDAFITHVQTYRDPKTGDAIVGASTSIVDLVKETNQALHGADSSWYRLPDTDAELRDILFVLENTSPDQLRRLMSPDFATLLVSVQIKWLEALSYQPLADHIGVGVARYFDESWEVQPTGTTFLVLSTLGAVTESLLSSFSVAFVGVTLLLMFFLQNLRLGLVAMIPNLVPIILVAGFMVLADIPLTLGNILNASLALGICVDDTIHFLHYFQRRHQEHGDVELAIQESMRHTGRAIVITSAVLGISTVVFLLATLKSYQSFTYLMSLTVCLAVIADLVIAPAILRIVFRNTTTEERLSENEPVSLHGEFA